MVDKRATQNSAPAAPGPVQPAPADLTAGRPQDATASHIKDALAVLFAFRTANVLCVRTFFQPDEYFQALEPAWQFVFGPQSGAWMTWEWHYQLRSSLHPVIFSIGYGIVGNYLATLSLSPRWNALALLAAPKVIQAGFAALSDWYTWRLAEKLFGRNSAAAWAVLLMNMANPWQWYCSTRTFSNSLEATLTAAALYYFPWGLLGGSNTIAASGATSVFKAPGSVRNLRISLMFAAIAVILRPTNVFIWLAIATIVLTRLTLDGDSPLTYNVLAVLTRETLLVGSLTLGLSLVADRQYFGEWTFPPLNWLHFNIAQSLAIFYGQNDWHYYLSQGIPLSCTTVAPFAIRGLWSATGPILITLNTKNVLRTLSFAVLTSIATLSFVVHKEVRFIFPLIPILHILAAPHITYFFTASKAGGIPTSTGAIGVKRKPLLVFGLAVNLTIAAYLSYFHAVAPISVMSYLRNEFEKIHPDSLAIPTPFLYQNETAEPLELFALFLTPCHTTPWRSHLVYPALRAHALTCEPPLHTAPGSPERAAYEDESHRFDADKIGFMNTELWPADGESLDLPRYIIGFEGIEPALNEYFGPGGPGADKGVKLKQTWSAWNGLFTDDDRKAGEIRVWDTGVY